MCAIAAPAAHAQSVTWNNFTGTGTNGPTASNRPGGSAPSFKGTRPNPAATPTMNGDANFQMGANGSAFALAGSRARLVQPEFARHPVHRPGEPLADRVLVLPDPRRDLGPPQ